MLSVNFRGSTGFGKKFLNAGNKEWAGKMHDDLVDAVEWAVDAKIADPQKIAIMGGSYGGYATLVGLTFTPDVFACGVDIVGPSNLVTLLNTIPALLGARCSRSSPGASAITAPRTGASFLARSLAALARRRDQAAAAHRPGRQRSPREAGREPTRSSARCRRKGMPVTYVLFPDEGHGFARPENSLSFYAVAEVFLAQHLGGRYQPVGDDFKGSSITVPAGADQIYGLTDALPKR